MDNMVTGTTKSGFAYEIEADVFDDWDTLDIIRKIQNGDTLAVFDLITRILGDEQTAKLKDHIRTKTGRVPISKANTEIFEILSAQTSGNSSASSD